MNMMQPSRKTRLHVLFVVLALLGYLFLAQLSTMPQDGKFIHLDASFGGAEVQMPQSWLETAQGDEGRIFESIFYMERLPAEKLKLYIPSFERELAVYLNGSDITHFANTMDWKGPLSSGSALVTLPDQLLKRGPNELALHVSTEGGRRGSLSQAYIGEGKELTSHFKRRLFFEQNLKVIIFTLQFVLVVTCLILLALRPTDRRFGLLGLAMFLACLVTLGVFSDVFEILPEFVSWALILIPSGGFSFLAFIHLLERQYQLPGVKILLIAAPTILYGAVFIGLFDLRFAMIYFAAPICASSLTYAFFILNAGFWRRPTVDRAFLLAGLMLVIGSIIHDMLLKLRVINDGVLVTQYAWLLTVMGVVAFLISYLASLAADSDQAAKSLNEKLRERELELEAIFEREKKLALEIATQSQKDLIMADLHDGVAGHLSTIVALCDVGGPTASEIDTVARHALSELRMLIDSFVDAEGGLLISLASLRERLVAPIERLGVEVDWSFISFPNVTWMSPDQTLSVLRILQETAANAVRHGRPKRLVFEGERLDDRFAVIRVTNTGGASFSRAVDGKQYGLQNIEMRAQRLGGAIRIIGLPGGTMVELIVPLSRDSGIPSTVGSSENFVR